MSSNLAAHEAASRHIAHKDAMLKASHGGHNGGQAGQPSTAVVIGRQAAVTSHATCFIHVYPPPQPLEACVGDNLKLVVMIDMLARAQQECQAGALSLEYRCSGFI